MSSWIVEPGYREYPPHTNMCAVALDRQIAAGLADRVALRFEGGAWSYGELADEVGRIAGGYQALGVACGDRILFRCRNVPEFVAALLAAFKIGAVPVLTSTLLTMDELDYILTNSGARVAVTLDDFAQPLRQFRAQARLDNLIVIAGDAQDDGEIDYASIRSMAETVPATAETDAMDPALLLYSSGTTGPAKGVLHAHRWIISVGDIIRLQMQYGSDDIVMTPGEFSFMATFGHCLMAPLSAGACCALYARRPAPDDVFAAIARDRVTKFMSVPTFYRGVLSVPDPDRQYDLSSVAMWVSGGEALAGAVIDRWEARFGKPLYDMYGISELEVVIGNSLVFDIKRGSPGKLLPGVKLSLRDERLAEVGVDEPGRVMVHRTDPGLFIDYFGQREKWRQAHRGEWYDTGDVMRRDADGYYWFLGRQDDLFKSRGMFVSPQEVEDALMRHPDVVEAAIIGEPDDRVGNRVVAFVVAGSGRVGDDALAAEILTGLTARLAPYKRPKEIKFVDGLPKNVVGKIVRSKLQKALTQG